MARSRPNADRTRRLIVAAVTAAALAAGLVGTWGADIAGACGNFIRPGFADIASSEGTRSPAYGEILAVQKRVHRAATPDGSTSISVTVRHWGADAPTEPQTGAIHDDSGVEADPEACGGAGRVARSAGTVEYRLRTSGMGWMELRGEPDEAALTARFGEPVDLEVDEPAVAASIATVVGASTDLDGDEADDETPPRVPTRNEAGSVLAPVTSSIQVLGGFTVLALLALLTLLLSARRRRGGDQH